MPKVSVIIPVYGVERFIERCVDSLFNQTLDNIEFIFIDDCTPDNSMSLLHAQIKKYKQRIDAQNWSIKLERMSVNSGLAAVRRYGISLATGQYVIHCDSDDWVDLNMYETLYNKAIQTNADIVICDFYQVDENNRKHIKACYSAKRDDIIIDFMRERGFWALWNKIIRRDLYSNVEFYPKVSMGEDMVVTLQLLYFSNSITYIDQPYYYYYINANSIVRDLSNEKILNRFNQAIINTQIIENFFKNNEDGYRYKFALDFVKLRHRNLILPLIKQREYFDIWRQTYPNLKFRIWYNPFINLRLKLKFYLTSLGLI